jgi:hypothetical protein
MRREPLFRRRAGTAATPRLLPLKRFRAKHALGLDPWVDTGSRKENASKQEARASVLIQSEPIML